MIDYKINVAEETICSECTRRCNMFNPLSDEEMEYLHNNRYVARFKAGEVIFKQGSPLSHIVSFSKGLGKLYMENETQNDVIIGIIKPGSIIGGPCLYLDRRHHYSFAALMESLVCFIDVNAFQVLIKNNHQFADLFLHDMSEKSVMLMGRLLNVTLKQSHGRVADLLLHLSDEIFKSDRYDITLSRQELADFTGMSKEGTIRILKEFKTDGLIDFQNQHFELLDKKRLHEVSVNG
jgi:CRP/FNR family transcriptional regulator, polysaccharide utilization system transcription regulator